MLNTGSFTLNYPIPNVAIGYVYKPLHPFQWRNNISILLTKGTPAGGGFVTAPDLHKFSLALLSNKLVKKETLDKMWNNYSPKEGYGYGFFVREVGNTKIVGHSGGTVGVSNNMDMEIKDGYITIILSNYDQGAFSVDEYIRSSLLNLIN